jgi:hypothetical protein
VPGAACRAAHGTPAACWEGSAYAGWACRQGEQQATAPDISLIAKHMEHQPPAGGVVLALAGPAGKKSNKQHPLISSQIIDVTCSLGTGTICWAEYQNTCRLLGRWCLRWLNLRSNAEHPPLPPEVDEAAQQNTRNKFIWRLVSMHV